MDPVPFQALARGPVGEASDTVRERVRNARARQAARCGEPTGRTNADLTGRRLARHCALDAASLSLLDRAMAQLGLTGRAFDRVRRVARTIADLEDSASIRRPHVAEALQYR